MNVPAIRKALERVGADLDASDVAWREPIIEAVVRVGLRACDCECEGCRVRLTVIADILRESGVEVE